MQKTNIVKILSIGIICLFVAVGIHPAFAVETRQSIVNKASEEECWECKEVDTKYLVILEKQLNRLEVSSKFLLALSKINPEIKEKCEEIFDKIHSEVLLDFPIVCDVLLSIFNKAVELAKYYLELASKGYSGLHTFVYGFLFGIYSILADSTLNIMNYLDCDNTPYKYNEIISHFLEY